MKNYACAYHDKGEVRPHGGGSAHSCVWSGTAGPALHVPGSAAGQRRGSGGGGESDSLVKSKVRGHDVSSRDATCKSYMQY